MSVRNVVDQSYPCLASSVQNAPNTSTTSSDLYSTLESLGKKCQNLSYGKKLYGPLRTAEEGGVEAVLIPASEQGIFNFVEGLQHICAWMGLDKDSQVWWIGGDLTGIYQEEGTQKAIHALEVFARRFFQDGMGNMRKDRLMVSEYAGPERNYGKECCAIRCVAKMLEKMPEMANSVLPYGVVNSAAWFQDIGAVPQNGARHLYVVHGDRPGSSDPWDSNGLARNALIVEGGSRTLGYIFDIIANGGQVMGLHGFRDNSPDFFDTASGKPILSAAKFVGELCEYIKNHPDAEDDDVMRFWNDYTSTWLPYNPNTSDAHTKQYFIDAAWDVFKTHQLKDKIAAHFKCYSYDSFVSCLNF